jgi:hypothetical protein
MITLALALDLRDGSAGASPFPTRGILFQSWEADPSHRCAKIAEKILVANPLTPPWTVH